jgi:D-lactate dehydrogenase
MTTREPTIAAFEIEPWQHERLQQSLPQVECHSVEGPLDEQSVTQAGDASVVSVFIRSRVNRAIIERMPEVQLITTRLTGFDHIDLAACAGRGILVCNVPTYGEYTVAEHTFSLILALSRRLAVVARRTAHGDFSLRGLMGFDLRGKTLGVIGVGNIGLHVIRIGGLRNGGACARRAATAADR